MKKRILSVIDRYLEYPILSDILTFGIFKLISLMLCSWLNFCIIIAKDTTLQSLLNELVSSSIGISGFIIALFTIIVAFRESAGNKNNEEKNNGFVWILRGKYYKNIVKVFSQAFLSSVFAFVFFSFLEIAWANFDNQLALDLVVFGLLILVMSMLRCFLILSKLVQIEIEQNS